MPNYKDALLHLNKALDIDPNHIPSISLISEIYLTKGMYTELENLVNDTLVNNFDNPELYYILARKNLICSKLDKSLEYIEKAIAGSKIEIRFYKLAIEVHEKNNSSHQSVPYLEKMIELCPNDGTLYYKLSRLIKGDHTTEKKLLLLETTLDLIPKHYPAMHDMALLYLNYLLPREKDKLIKQQHIKKAKDYLISLLSSELFKPKSFLMLGKLEILFGTKQKAIEFLENATLFNETKGQASFELGEISLSLGSNEEALRYFRTSIKLGTEKGKSLFKLGTIFLELGKREKSIEFFKMCESSIQIEVDKLIKESEVHANILDFESAKLCIRYSLELKKILSNAMLNIYQLTNRAVSDDSIKILHDILSVSYTNPDVHYQIGILYLKNGNLDKAKEYFTSACEINWEHILSHLELGKIAIKEANYTSSKMHLQIVLDLQPNHRESTSLLKQL